MKISQDLRARLATMRQYHHDACMALRRSASQPGVKADDVYAQNQAADFHAKCTATLDRLLIEADEQ